MSSNKIEAIMIFEMLGRPKEHLTKEMDKLLDVMKEEEGVEIIYKDVKEPVVAKQDKNFFTTFAQVEMKAKDMLYLVRIIFKYMPSNIDITYPENITITNNSWSEILNEITRRLHGYDEVARVLQLQKQELSQKLEEEEKKKEE